MKVGWFFSLSLCVLKRPCKWAVSRQQGTDEGSEWACTPVSATVQLLLTSCARHSNHYLQDNVKSNEPIKLTGLVPITLNPHCQSGVKCSLRPKRNAIRENENAPLWFLLFTISKSCEWMVVCVCVFGGGHMPALSLSRLPRFRRWAIRSDWTASQWEHTFSAFDTCCAPEQCLL